MNSIILSIGDELILGQTVDTNSAWLAQQCAAIGIRPVRHATVSDAQEDIEMAIVEAAQIADVLLISGGLGPTEDDVTRDALAAVLDVPLALNPAALENVERFFKALNRPMPERNKVQAMIPRGARMIENTNGTAPGLRATLRTEIADPGGDDEAFVESECEIFIMPGVPKEMKAMFERSVLPALREIQKQQGGPGPVILSKTLHTFGLGESAIAELLKPADLMNRARNPSVGTTVAGGVVSLRLNAYFDSPEKSRKKLAETEQKCRAALGDLIYGEDNETLPQIVAQLLLNPEPRTPNPEPRTPNPEPSSNTQLTTAESCTGGLLAKMLTDLPGSSAWFKYGWVTYSNEAKISLLDVPPQTLEEHGAVSEQVAAEMARSALKLAAADYALAISGIAGPTGGTPNKPVGTVCIALASRSPTQDSAPGTSNSDSPQHPALSTQHSISTRTFLFAGDREMIRDRSAKMALTMLRYHLLGKSMPF